MFRIKIPLIDDLTEQSEDLKLEEYHLYSSIFEATPRLSLKMSTSYETPDALNLYLGSSFPIQYQITKETEQGPEDENPKEPTAPEDLAGLFVSKAVMKTEGPKYTLDIQCDSEFLALQKSDTRKAYTATYGNQIVDDLITNNSVLSKYSRNVQATDNAATIYRSLGENDLSIVLDSLKRVYTIAGGQPLFYIGLDKKVNFTSINKLFSVSKKSNLLIRTGGVDDDLSIETKNELIPNYVDEKNYIDVKATEFEFTLGGANSVFNIKTAAYYTSYNNGLINTVGYILKPATDEKTYYPINKVFLETTNANQTVSVFNRPVSNLCYEAKNYFEPFENLIAIRLKLADCGKLQKLYVAGELATVILPYAYSVYNGNYIISEIEYGQKGTNSFVELVLIRPNIDLKWAEKLNANKDSENFKLPVAIEPNKSLLYSI